MDAKAVKNQKRQRMASSDRRQAFIEKAIEYFAEKGFESSTRELARRLGVTQPLLYRYFPSKDDLISEVYNTVYINRWRDEWGGILRDRNRPLRERMIDFYTAYTDVVFQRDWMRIFLFSSLKGVDINRRYLAVVRERILIPIVEEARHADGLTDTTPTKPEVEYTLVMHGGIYHSGVRRVLYEGTAPDDRDFVITTSVDAYLAHVRTLRDD